MAEISASSRQDWQTSSQGPLGACSTISDYQKLHRIGEGTYGFVYKAIHIKSGRTIALKRIILHNEQQDGFPLTSIRELRVLQACKHDNIVSLLDVAVGPKRDAVFLAFEYCDHDLHSLIHHAQHNHTITSSVGSKRAFSETKRSFPFTESQVKCLSLQLLSALEYLHGRFVVHRDVKLSNVLYCNRSGALKLADFGLARTLALPPPADLTPTVVTLWYRAPELLLRAPHYSFAVDMWSAGCVIGELLGEGLTMMRGDTELAQLEAIFRLLGAPSERIWPGMQALPLLAAGALPQLQQVQQRHAYNTLHQRFPALHAEGLDLLQALLRYDPARRLSAREARRHAYWRTAPQPSCRDLMPAYPSSLLPPPSQPAASK